MVEPAQVGLRPMIARQHAGGLVSRIACDRRRRLVLDTRAASATKDLTPRPCPKGHRPRGAKRPTDRGRGGRDLSGATHAVGGEGGLVPIVGRKPGGFAGPAAAGPEAWRPEGPRRPQAA